MHAYMFEVVPQTESLFVSTKQLHVLCLVLIFCMACFDIQFLILPLWKINPCDLFAVESTHNVWKVENNHENLCEIHFAVSEMDVLKSFRFVHTHILHNYICNQIIT